MPTEYTELTEDEILYHQMSVYNLYKLAELIADNKRLRVGVRGSKTVQREYLQTWAEKLASYEKIGRLICR